MSRRPLRQLMERFFQARVQKTITVTTAGVLVVTVNLRTPKNYVGKTVWIDCVWDTGVMAESDVAVDWGDGSLPETYIEPAPMSEYSHIYASPATYIITVTVVDAISGASGTGTASQQIANALTVDFTADKTSGTVPLTVVFTIDIGGGFAPYVWSLNPGDGTTTYGAPRATPGSFNQSHTYVKAGTFTATVTVDDSLGTSVMSKIPIGAGVRILFPKLREMFPRLFGKIDEVRGRVREKREELRGRMPTPSP